MKTITNAEFIKEIERERNSSAKVVGIAVLVFVFVLAVILILLVSNAEKEKSNVERLYYRDNLQICQTIKSTENGINKIPRREVCK